MPVSAPSQPLAATEAFTPGPCAAADRLPVSPQFLLLWPHGTENKGMGVKKHDLVHRLMVDQSHLTGHC